MAQDALTEVFEETVASRYDRGINHDVVITPGETTLVIEDEKTQSRITETLALNNKGLIYPIEISVPIMSIGASPR